jgi:hypothetical protein
VSERRQTIEEHERTDETAFGCLNGLPKQRLQKESDGLWRFG